MIRFNSVRLYVPKFVHHMTDLLTDRLLPFEMAPGYILLRFYIKICYRWETVNSSLLSINCDNF